MRNMDEVLNQPVIGDADGDFDIWQDVYRIAADTSLPLTERARAVRHMDVLTGEKQSEGKDDITIVTEFCNEMLLLTGVVEETLEEIGGEIHVTAGDMILAEQELRHLQIIHEAGE